MEELLKIYNELTLLFDSVESFEKYYSRNLINKSTVNWGNELEKELYKIHDFLKGIFLEKINVSTVRLWTDRVREWDVHAKAIRHRIDENLKEYEAYYDILPECYYPSSMIEDQIKKTGKSYEQVCAILVKQIEQEVFISKTLKPYVDESCKVLNLVVHKMENRFNSILEKSLTTSNNSNLLNKREINLVKKSFQKASKINLPTFEVTGNNHLVIGKIYSKLFSAKPPFIKNTESEFNLLFNGEPSSIKIDWLKGKNQLHEFIDKLVKKEIIVNSDNNLWEKVGYYFTHKSKPIKVSLNNYNTISTKKKREIESLFS